MTGPFDRVQRGPPWRWPKAARRLALGLGLGLVGCEPSELNLEVRDGLPCGDQHDLCDGQCLRVDDDPDNCGSCGRACGDDQVCFKGNCTNTCGAGCSSTKQVCVVEDFCDCREGLSFCDSRCVDLERDPENCGRCGTTCDEGRSCEFGECVQAQCVDSPEVCSGSCTNIDDDILNCGACGKACESNEVCIASECKAYFSVSPQQCDACPCSVCDETGNLCCQTEFLEGQVLCASSDVCF